MTVHKERTDDYMHGLGANERAILERIPSRPLRRLAARTVRAKMRAQFTGWLQYLLPIVAIVPLGLIGAIAQLLGATWLAAPLLGAAGLVLAIALFDLVTVKYRLRFPERRPTPNDDIDLFDLMRARRSCRSFQTRSLSEPDRAELFESVRAHIEEPILGPTPVRLEYIAAPLTVWPTVNATEFLVAIVPKEYNRTSVIDVGRCLQKVVMDATRMGLGTCWIGPGADHASILRHLGDRFDADRDQIICVCAVGYKSKYIPLFVRVFNFQFKRRLPLSELVFSDSALEQPVDVTTEPYARFGRAFEICQWAPSSYNGQTTRCVVVTDTSHEVGRVDFYATTASRYYAPVALGIWASNWEMGCDALDIEGTFEILTHESQETLPHYDLSWLPTRRS
jgi:nitroreductase